MFQRSSSTPIRPVSLTEMPQANHYQQPWAPGPISSPTILPFELGSTIEDPVRGSSYNLIQPLGNGSYAVVYMVRNKKDNKYYALKCLSKANLSDYHLAIQHNEVTLHERVTGHPNLVKLHHTFETPEWLFLVMEYCDGQDLYFWLTQNNDTTDPYSGRRLTERERLELMKQVFTQILDAVGHCHDNGIAHRDLKPENFIVTVSSKNGDVQVKLTDFGLATDELESSDFDCGSKPYMSYECRNAVRETYHPRLADIWSLGIIFLNLIYHRSPWSDPSPDHCRSFASFQLDKVSFLQNRFERMPDKVAHFLATRVFCRPEEGRVSIREWRFWCQNLVQKMMEEEEEEEIFHVDDLGLHKLSLSAERNSQWRYSRVRKESWSDIMTDNEMDFTVPVTFTDDEGSRRASVNKIKEPRIGIPKVEAENKAKENKDVEQQNVDVNANNSDADSGFGTDEDGSASITKRGRAQENVTSASKATRTSGNATLSITPPKVIHCKPRPWGETRETREQKEQRERGHQREPSSVDHGSPPNNHWNSYNQRRERLERQRKEKEEKKLDMLAQNRRRGSSVGSQDAFSHAVNSFPRRTRPYRPSQNRVVYFNISVTPPKNLKSTPPTSPTKLNHFEPKNSPPETYFATDISNKKLQHKVSRENLAPNANSPVKVAKSTKTNLGRMLEKMVVFNRGVKVGGQGVDS